MRHEIDGTEHQQWIQEVDDAMRAKGHDTEGWGAEPAPAPEPARPMESWVVIGVMLVAVVVIGFIRIQQWRGVL